MSFENTVGKGEIARNEQILLFLQCFIPFWRTFYQFHQVWNCCYLSLDESKISHLGKGYDLSQLKGFADNKTNVIQK